MGMMKRLSERIKAYNEHKDNSVHCHYCRRRYLDAGGKKIRLHNIKFSKNSAFTYKVCDRCMCYVKAILFR